MAAEPFVILGGLRLEDGTAWADRATEAQLADAGVLLDPAAGTVRRWIGRSRGYSKTTDVAGATLAALVSGLIGAGERGYVVAADRDQARLLIDAIAGFVRRTPGLSGAVEVGTWAVTNRKTGATVMSIASDASSSFGLRGCWWVVDELCQWPETEGARRFYEAISSAWPKTRSRVAVISTAGTLTHWSRGVYEHALTDPLWTVSETTGPAPWIDPALIDSERARLPESVFARLWLNHWTDASNDPLVSAATLDRCLDLPGPAERMPRRDYVVCADLGVRHDATAVVVAHAESVDDVRHVLVDRLDVLAPAPGGEVDLALARDLIWRRSCEYGAVVRLDRWQALGIAQDLRARSIRVEEVEMTVSAISGRALALRQLLTEARLHLPADDRDLRDELLAARLVERSGAWRIDHSHGRHDDRVQAIAYAVEALLARPERRVVICSPGGARKQAATFAASHGW